MVLLHRLEPKRIRRVLDDDGYAGGSGRHDDSEVGESRQRFGHNPHCGSPLVEERVGLPLSRKVVAADSRLLDMELTRQL